MPPKKYPPKSVPAVKKPDKSLPKETVKLKDSDDKEKKVTFQKGGLRRSLDYPDDKAIPKGLMKEIANAKEGDEVIYLDGKKKIKVTRTLKRQAVLGLNLMKA